MSIYSTSSHAIIFNEMFEYNPLFLLLTFQIDDEQKGFVIGTKVKLKIPLQQSYKLFIKYKQNINTERTKSVSRITSIIRTFFFLLFESSSCLLFLFMSSNSRQPLSTPIQLFFPTHRILFARRAETS